MGPACAVQVEFKDDRKLSELELEPRPVASVPRHGDVSHERLFTSVDQHPSLEPPRRRRTHPRARSLFAKGSWKPALGDRPLLSSAFKMVEHRTRSRGWPLCEHAEKSLAARNQHKNLNSNRWRSSYIVKTHPREINVGNHGIEGLLVLIVSHLPVLFARSYAAVHQMGTWKLR